MMRFWASVGLGAYVGLAVGGVVGVVSGQVFAADSPWLTALPVLMLLGAPTGLVLARLSRRWLLPGLAYRTRAFVIGGIVNCPLVVAVGHTSPIEIPLGFMVAGGAVTATLWRRHRKTMALGAIHVAVRASAQR